MEYVIGLSVVATLFLAIIANGQWAAKRRDALRKNLMEEIKEVVSAVDKLASIVRRHHEDQSIHGHTDHLVTNQLCEERVKRIEASQQSVMEMLKEALRGISKAMNGKRNIPSD